METTILNILLEQGVAGLIAGFAFFLFWRERTDHAATREARFSELKELTALFVKNNVVLEQVIKAVERLEASR